MHYPTLQGLKALVGQVIGTSEWIAIPQSRIQQFADATGDNQWIHIDPQRAATGPFKTTVAHGFLTLSLLPRMMYDAYAIDDLGMGVNYGLNRVRFPAPVPSGSRVCGVFKLLRFEPIDGGAQLTSEATIELEGSAKPACVAESVSRLFTKHRLPS
jgi:acyl dehydratase